MSGEPHVPRLEKGYLIVFCVFFVLVGTIAYACWYQYTVTTENYEIAMINYELAKNGVYLQIPAVTADYTIYNWIITALSAAFAVVSSAQLIKKSRNNVYQYAEQWIDKWMSDAEVRPYIAQIVQSWIGSNPTTMSVSK